MTADSVTPEEIQDQRAQGWPDFHPEDYCHRCGRRNFVWFADSAQWNLAEGGPEGILCPTCFTDDHEKATGEACSWRLAPAERSDVVSALTISEAEMRHRLAEVEAELAEVRRAEDGGE